MFNLSASTFRKPKVINVSRVSLQLNESDESTVSATSNQSFNVVDDYSARLLETEFHFSHNNPCFPCNIAMTNFLVFLKRVR